MNVIAASRRAADVPRLITSQADVIYTFNQSEPRDISYLAEFAGKDFAEETRTLPRFHALVYRSFDQTISRRVSDSPKETIITLRRSSSLPKPVISQNTPIEPAPEDDERHQPEPENDEETA
jgi:hypothetical protein